MKTKVEIFLTRLESKCPSLVLRPSFLRGESQYTRKIQSKMLLTPPLPLLRYVSQVVPAVRNDFLFHIPFLVGIGGERVSW